MRARYWIQTGLVLLLFAGIVGAQKRESLFEHLAATPDWSVAGNARTYDAANAAELGPELAQELKMYGLRGVTVQSWQGPQGRVGVTLFEMTDPSAAYGVFTLRRSEGGVNTPDPSIGTESLRRASALYFWQSNYLVRIEGGEAAARAAGLILSAEILGRSIKPPVVSHLPPENLVPFSESYILDSKHIRFRLGVDASTLGFDESVEAAVADYRIGSTTAHLVLLMYPTQQVAKKYEDSLNQQAGTSENRRRSVKLLAIVAGTSDPMVLSAILDQVHYESKVTWNEPRPDVSIADVILNIFRFIGIALLFTVVVGVGYGGLRVFVKWRYPEKVFDRPENAEFIQLKLDQGFTRKELGE